MMNKVFWGELALDTGLVSRFRYDNCLLWIKRENDELWVAYNYLQKETDKLEEHPKEETDWCRWALKGVSDAFLLQPRMPNLPVVVRPESDFYLLPGAEVRIYVLVPVWVRIRVANKLETKIVKIPTEVLSKTWFGTHIEGELCYWVSSSALREYSDLACKEHHCICPVQIKNTSDEKLLISKFCLRVKYLTMYTMEHQLWANETKVFYKGLDEISEVKVISGAPKEAAKAEKISLPIEPPGRNFTVKTFSTLKGWYDKTSSLVSIDRFYNQSNGDK